MANSPSKIVLVAGAVMGIAAMVMLNSMNKTPKSEEEQEHEQEAAAQKSAPPASVPSVLPYKAKPMVPVRPGMPAASGTDTTKPSDLVGLGQDKVVGVSAAGPEVNIRFSWTPTVQNDPKKVYDAVAAVKSAAPNARIHVINTDENPGAPDGVYVGSKQIAPAAADGSISVKADAVKSAVAAAPK